MEKCNGCTSLKSTSETMTRFLSKLDNHEERIAKLERTSDVTQEKLNNIDKTLTKIDGGIENLGKKIDKVDKKPFVFMDKVLAAVCGGVCTFVVIEIVKSIKS